MDTEWTAEGTDVLDANGFMIAEVAETAILRNWDALGIEHWARAPGVAFIEVPTEEAEARAELFAAAPRLKQERDVLLEAAQRVIAVTPPTPAGYRLRGAVAFDPWVRELIDAQNVMRAAIEKCRDR